MYQYVCVWYTILFPCSEEYMLCSCLFVEALTKYKICFIAIHNAICRHQLETSHFANFALAKEMYTSRGWLGFAPHEILRFVKETHIKRKYENSCLFKAFLNMSICASSGAFGELVLKRTFIWRRIL